MLRALIGQSQKRGAAALAGPTPISPRARQTAPSGLLPAAPRGSSGRLALRRGPAAMDPPFRGRPVGVRRRRGAARDARGRCRLLRARPRQVSLQGAKPPRSARAFPRFGLRAALLRAAPGRTAGARRSSARHPPRGGGVRSGCLTLELPFPCEPGPPALPRPDGEGIGLKWVASLSLLALHNTPNYYLPGPQISVSAEGGFQRCESPQPPLPSAQ